MFTYGSEIEVARSPSEVFSGILDIERWTEWTDMRTSALTVRAVGSGRPARSPFPARSGPDSLRAHEPRA